MTWSIQDIMSGNKFVGFLFKNDGGKFSSNFVAKLQTGLATSTINAPGSAYVATSSSTDILDRADDAGFVSTGPDAGSEQCVALVKAVVPAMGAAKAGSTARWRRTGDRLTKENAGALTPGTVVGYGFDQNGDYPSLASGNHVAVFVSFSNGAFRILDQWAGHEASERETPLANKEWYVVTVK